MAIGLELRFPKLLACSRIKSPETMVRGSRNEHQASGRDYRTAQILRAGVVYSFGFEFIYDSERHTPDDLAFIQINSNESPPGRLLTRPIVPIAEPGILLEPAPANVGYGRTCRLRIHLAHCAILVYVYVDRKSVV